MNMSVKAKSRDQIIIRTSIIGIAANIFLAGFKAFVGILSNSIAIVLDAVNNLSDALSSVITIVGTKLAGRAPDKKHPLGYGRIEYLSAAIISVIVLYAGVTSFTESVRKIIHPETPDYSALTLVIVASGVLVKILLGRYVRATGEKVGSDSLVASGSDALNDSIISASTLVAAVLYIKAGWSLEAWLGAVISVIIIKSGLEMLRDTISQILGERIDKDISVAVKQLVSSFPEVNGAYDLFLHTYGPEKTIGSVHIEIPDTMTAYEIDTLERRIQREVFAKLGIILAGISIYSVNSLDPEITRIKDHVNELVFAHPGVLQTHGFYVNTEDKIMNMDIVIDFAQKNGTEIFGRIVNDLKEAYPDYDVQVTLDADVSD